MSLTTFGCEVDKAIPCEKEGVRCLDVELLTSMAFSNLVSKLPPKEVMLNNFLDFLLKS
jgi:hypothetical protein